MSQSEILEKTKQVAQALLTKLDHNASVEVVETESGILISIQGENASELVGFRGEVMYALQVILRLMLLADLTPEQRLILDVDGYRGKREEQLIKLAQSSMERAQRGGEPVSLAPMNAYERRIIHMAIQEIEGARSESSGEGKNRHIVIYFGNQAA